MTLLYYMTPSAPISPFHAPSPLRTCCISGVQRSQSINPGSAIRASLVMNHDDIGAFSFHELQYCTTSLWPPDVKQFFALPRSGSDGVYFSLIPNVFLTVFAIR